MLIGLFSLRLRTIFFAMITLAVASAFLILASQLSDLTGGEDGLNYRCPMALRPCFRPFEEACRPALNGRVLDYYLVYFVSLALVLMLLRIVNSPFGSVLMAIRENPFRAEAIGYRTVVYRTLASCIAAATAALAGALLALWSSQTNPDTTLSFDIMVDILLMVVIGGMGTIYGAVIGAVLLVFAQNYLQDLLAHRQQGAGRRAAARQPVPPRPLAAVARRRLHPLRLLLPDRHRRQAAGVHQGGAVNPSVVRVEKCGAACRSSRSTVRAVRNAINKEVAVALAAALVELDARLRTACGHPHRRRRHSSAPAWTSRPSRPASDEPIVEGSGLRRPGASAPPAQTADRGGRGPCGGRRFRDRAGLRPDRAARGPASACPRSSAGWSPSSAA